MSGSKILAAMLLLAALVAGAGNLYALSPPSEIVTDPSSTQLTTLVPNAQNMQQADILAVLNTETARIAREISAEPESAPATEGGGALPARRREEAMRLTVRQVAAGEGGLSAASALALNQIRERLADVHQAMAADATYTARADSAASLAAIAEGIQGPMAKILSASRTLVQVVRTPGALGDTLRAKADGVLAAIFPLVRSLETQIAEGTN